MADLDQENLGPGENAVTNLQVKVDKLSSLMERFMTRPEPVVQQNTGASSVALGPTKESGYPSFESESLGRSLKDMSHIPMNGDRKKKRPKSPLVILRI